MSLFIGNLSSQTTKEELTELFSKYGKCYIKHKGSFAFAEFDEEKDASRALEALKGKSVHERDMNIEWSKSSNKFEGSHHHHRRHYSPFKGKCFNCGHHGHFARNCPKDRRRSHSGHRSYKRKSSYDSRHRRRRSYSSISSSSFSSDSSHSRRRRKYRRRTPSYSRSRSYSKDSRDKRRSYSNSKSKDSSHDRKDKSEDKSGSEEKSVKKD